MTTMTPTEVVGLDRSETMVAMAGKRAQESAVSNVRFVRGDLGDDLSHLGLFDAVVGRRVLMYVPEPATVLRNLATILKPNGIVAFQESDATMSAGHIEALPLHEQVTAWLWRMVEREGANIHMGFALPGLLAKNGFSVEAVRAEAIIQGQQLHYPLADVVRAVLPRMIEHGVVTAQEVDIDTLAERLTKERGDHTVFVSELAFTIWGKKLP